jgi:putative hemolysin
MEEKEKSGIPADSKKLIDLENVIRKKNPKLLRYIPKFLINYLKRIIHQEEINDFICRNSNKQKLDFTKAIGEEYIKKIISTGVENIPKNGRCIIVSNHPLGGLDGIALINAVSEVREDVIFPVNDLLMNLENLHGIFIPINKHGSNAQNINILDDAFASDSVLLYFPAGLVSRKHKHGIIKDLEWKKTFLSKAKKFNRDIIPVFIEGKNSNFFYNLARLRKRLGIKANIEMLFLIDEVYKQKNNTINIVFGKPIPIATFDKRYHDKVWAEKIKEHVYSLKQDPDSDFNY